MPRNAYWLSETDILVKNLFATKRIAWCAKIINCYLVIFKIQNTEVIHGKKILAQIVVLNQQIYPPIIK